MNSELWILSKVMDFYPLLKNMGKRLSCKYGQKCPNSTKKAAIDRLKTASKTSIQKTLDPTDDLVPNKIVEKITKAALKNTFEDSSKRATQKTEPTVDLIGNKILKNISKAALISTY